jgi:fructose-1,6-bisphosphatase/inositol monophosphatase family enzyme
VKRPSSVFSWRAVIVAALQAATGAVKRLAPAAGRQVVAGREAGYRSWDPETIAADTAAERAVISALRRNGVHGMLLSEEAGAKTLTPAAGQAPAPESVYVVADPFDGSMLYRRGIPTQWFTAVGILAQDGTPRAAGLIDHLSGEMVLADGSGTVRLAHSNARPVAVRPSHSVRLAGASLEAYLMKPAFLYATATALRPLFEKAQFIFPNGGPGGFVDVACGRTDVYLAWNEALTEVFSACYIAEQAGCVVTRWDGSPVKFTPDIRATYALACSANARLHREVLRMLAPIRPPRGFTP